MHKPVDEVYPQRANESRDEWIERIKRKFGMVTKKSGGALYDPLYDEWSEEDSQFVLAWDGKRNIRLILPPSELRSITEEKYPIPPYHLRDMDDNTVGEHEYYPTFEVAQNYALILLKIDGKPIQIVNAFSNACGVVE